MAITLEERPIRTCHFGVFHISLGSTLCTESELKSDVALGNVPSLVQYYLIFQKSHDLIRRKNKVNIKLSINKYYVVEENFMTMFRSGLIVQNVN